MALLVRIPPEDPLNGLAEADVYTDDARRVSDER
jgi:hypothetical protein